MRHYRAFGVPLSSSIPLPLLETAPPTAAACSVDVWRHRPEAPRAWCHHWRLGSREPSVSFGSTPSGYLLRFAGAGDFEVARDGSRIWCPPEGQVPAATLEHLLLHQVVPLALSRTGLALHASAVYLPGVGAVAFAGRTGRGKSSLAAALASHGGVMADDCVRLVRTPAGFNASPAYRGLRLRSGRGEWSPAVAPAAPDVRFRDSPALLAAIFVLSARAPRDRSLSVRNLRAGERCMAVARHAYQLGVTDRETLARSFEDITALADSVPVLRLRVPDDYALLPEVARSIVDHVRPLAARMAATRA